MDIKALMRQAQEMQKKMQTAQEESAKTLYEGSAGGSMVKVTITGSKVTKKVEIDPSLIVAEEKEILEDLLVAAFNDASKKADESSTDSLKDMTKGMQLPPGFKL